MSKSKQTQAERNAENAARRERLRMMAEERQQAHIQRHGQPLSTRALARLVGVSHETIRSLRGVQLDTLSNLQSTASGS